MTHWFSPQKPPRGTWVSGWQPDTAGWSLALWCHSPSGKAAQPLSCSPSVLQQTEKVTPFIWIFLHRYNLGIKSKQKYRRALIYLKQKIKTFIESHTWLSNYELLFCSAKFIFERLVALQKALRWNGPTRSFEKTTENWSWGINMHGYQIRQCRGFFFCSYVVIWHIDWFGGICGHLTCIHSKGS